MTRYLIKPDGVVALDCKSSEDFYICDDDLQILIQSKPVRVEFLKSLRLESIIVLRLGRVNINTEEVVINKIKKSDNLMEDLYEYSRNESSRA